MKTAAQSVPSAVIRIAPPIRTLLARAISSTASSAMVREHPVIIAPTAAILPGVKAPIPQSARPKAEPISLSEARVSKAISSKKDGDGFGFGGDTEYNTWLRNNGHLEELGMVTKLIPDGMALTKSNIRKHRKEIKRHHQKASLLSANQHKKQMGSGIPRKVHANSGLSTSTLSVAATLARTCPPLDWRDSAVSNAVISNEAAMPREYKLGLTIGTHHKEVERVIRKQTMIYEARMLARKEYKYQNVTFHPLAGGCGNFYVFPKRRKEMFKTMREQRKERHAATMHADKMKSMSRVRLRTYIGVEVGWIDRHGWVNELHPNYTYNPGLTCKSAHVSGKRGHESYLRAKHDQLKQMSQYEAGITAFEDYRKAKALQPALDRVIKKEEEFNAFKSGLEYDRFLSAVAMLEGECPAWMSLSEYLAMSYHSIDDVLVSVKEPPPVVLGVVPDVDYEWDDEYAYRMYTMEREGISNELSYSNEEVICDQDLLDAWFECHCSIDEWFAVTERSTGNVADWVDVVYTKEDYRIAATAAMLARRVKLDLAPPPEGHVMTGSGIWVPQTIRQQLEESLHNEGYKETLILHGNEMFDELRDIRNGLISGTDRSVGELERSLKEIRTNMNEMERVEKSIVYSIPKGDVKFNPKRTVKERVVKKAKHLWSVLELKTNLFMHKLAAVV